MAFLLHISWHKMSKLLRCFSPSWPCLDHLPLEWHGVPPAFIHQPPVVDALWKSSRLPPLMCCFPAASSTSVGELMQDFPENYDVKASIHPCQDLKITLCSYSPKSHQQKGLTIPWESSDGGIKSAVMHLCGAKLRKLLPHTLTRLDGVVGRQTAGGRAWMDDDDGVKMKLVGKGRKDMGDSESKNIDEVDMGFLW